MSYCQPGYLASIEDNGMNVALAADITDIAWLGGKFDGSAWRWEQSGGAFPAVLSTSPWAFWPQPSPCANPQACTGMCLVMTDAFLKVVEIFVTLTRR